jgi:hypothetical protein
MFCQCDEHDAGYMHEVCQLNNPSEESPAGRVQKKN